VKWSDESTVNPRTDTNVQGNITVTATFASDAAPKDIARLSGINRYATAAAIAKDAFPGWSGVKNLVLASGDNNHQPDALTGAGLAGAYNCPLMLVPTNYLDADTKAAIASMPRGVKVHIVGGTPAVSTGVRNLIDRIPSVGTIDRISGPERYSTAAAVARKMKSVLGSGMPRTALITNGSSSDLLLDPLVAGTVSVSKHYPVLLVPNNIVPNATRIVLHDLGLSTRYIVGSTTAVNESVRTTLGVSAGNRIAGVDLAGDAAAFATRAKAEGWLVGSTVGFAASVPDAATGGAYMGKKSGPMLLVLPTTVPATTSDYLTTNKASITGGWLFGGPPAVSDAVLNALKGYIN
jgi:putative cell wall-binding protein